MVALVVITTGLLVLAGTMYSAFNSIGFSRQRNVATNLANQAMEQIKALSFNNLEMLKSDIQADSAVSCSQTGCTFKGRTIPTVTSLTGNPLQAPLYPHVSTSTPTVGTNTSGSKYTISSYVTFDPSGNTQARDATVVVTWNNAVVGGASDLVQIESTIFSTGALPVGTNGHAWNAQAIDNPGTVSISASVFLAGQLAALTFGPGSTSASISADGSANAAGNVAQSTLQILNQTLLHTNSSSSTASSASGQAPSAPSSNTVSNTGTLQTVNSILNLIDVGALSLTGGVGVQATTRAVAAGAANGSANLSGGVMPNSSLPYAQGLAQQTGPISLGLNTSLLNLFGIPLLSTSTNLLNITPLGNSNPDLSTVCEQSTSGAGCQNSIPGTGNTTGVTQTLPVGPAIVAQAQKSYASIQVLPSLPVPLLDIEGFTAAASAQAGPGITNSGKANVTAGTIKILGATYTLSQLLAGVASTVDQVSTAIGSLGVQVNVQLGQASTNGNTAIVGSPLAIGISLSIAGLINVKVTINLGSVSASASYS